MRDFGERIQTVDFVTKCIALTLIVTCCHTFTHSTFMRHPYRFLYSQFTFESCGKLGVSPTQVFYPCIVLQGGLNFW